MSASLVQEGAGDAVLSSPDPGLAALGPVMSATAPQANSPGVAQRVIGATSALSLGVFIERGAGFLANILAARWGGTSTFGAYSLAISSANQISTYAAGGIGATAARFSGKYSYGSPNYRNLARALALVSLISAALASAALYFGAGPIAHLLGKQELTSLLRWASLSAAGIIVLECARGFFVGQRRLVALVLLSLLVGAGMVLLLPAAARTHNPTRMIVLQGAITTTAVFVCLLLAGPLKLRAAATGDRGVPFPTMLREVWGFGLVQLAGLIGSNLAGWWLTTLVARTDTTLVQMSFFAIASQLRNLVGIAPSLLTEGSYAVMADPDGEAARTPHRVMALGSYASLGVALLLASVGILVIPWALTLLYGRAYAPAAITVAIGLAIAVVHMGNAPAAARLTIVSIRATGVINTVWAIFVAAAATLFLFFGGGAWQAMAIYFAGHVLSSTLVLITLDRKDGLPPGMSTLFAFGALCSASLATLAYFRAMHPDAMLALTGVMAAVTLLALSGLLLFGRRFQWLPSTAALHGISDRIMRRRHV